MSLDRNRSFSIWEKVGEEEEEEEDGRGEKRRETGRETLCSSTIRFSKAALTGLTLAVIRLSRSPSGSLGNAKLPAN